METTDDVSVLGKSRAEREAWVAAHPFQGALLLGTAWGVLTWLGYGTAYDALNVSLFASWLTVGLVFFGPIMVVFVRRKRSGSDGAGSQ